VTLGKTSDQFLRDSRQVVKDAEGWNSGPPASLLGEQFVTPAPLFFTRSHAPVPELDPSTWRLRVHGLVRRPLELGLDALRDRFPRAEVTATLACAGLRRTELLAVRPVPGELPWGPEAVSTGTWAGVSLTDVLVAAGHEDGGTHVEFIGRDDVTRSERRFGFGGSIPLGKAMSREVLLAFELNGSPLPPEHGFPLRAVVPGYYGARSVKWLGEVVVRADPSSNYFQRQAYRVLRTPDPNDPRDVSQGAPLGELALNAAILSPGPGEQLRPGDTEIRGWSMGRGGGAVGRVEVSRDGGQSWIEADLCGPPLPWCWRLWRARIHLPLGRHTLVVRAFDQTGAGQPERLEDVWNVKGYANNAWHRVSVDVSARE
jgi:sulfite oxidase